jgi:hypothetical protein
LLKVAFSTIYFLTRNGTEYNSALALLWRRIRASGLRDILGRAGDKNALFKIIDAYLRDYKAKKAYA